MKHVILTLALAVASLGLTAQNWKIDASHTRIGFTVDHMVVSETEGNFQKFEGAITAAKPDFSDAKGTITINVASVNTEDKGRDDHLRGADFFEVAKYPNMTFELTGIKKVGGKSVATGFLTIKDVRKAVEMETTVKGPVADPWGNQRIGFKATTTIDRQAYNVKFTGNLSGGGLLVGDEVRITINTEFILEKPAPAGK